jgi:molybdate transport repressor ModE-like protein
MKYALACIMRVAPAFGWILDGDPPEPLDGRLLPLLDAIARTSSLAAAVAERGISYRAAWGLLRDCERRFAAPLVALERGRGARLTATGEALLRAQTAATQRLARILPALAVEIGPAQRTSSGALPLLRLRVAASHDLALARLAESLPESARVALDLAVAGSLHALAEFADGRVDLAGFHVPIRGVAADTAPFVRWLSARRDRLVRFVDREQGLILPRGNPARVRSFRDLAAKRLRFVNRQRGSGTRLLVERLASDDGVVPSALAGWSNEEFTHAAVAATVASGGADAGFGLRAAAAEYGLAFVPLVRERYFLAVRARDTRAAPFARLIAALRGREFIRLARQLPGYDPAGAGAVVGIETLPGAWATPAPPPRSRGR